MGIIRLLLSLSVLVAHSEGKFKILFSAPEAVFSFFVISGFYMALILDNKYESKIVFYLNRFLRIFPIYWIVLFLTVALALGKTSLLGSSTNFITHYFQYSSHLSGSELTIETINYIFRNLTLIISKDYFGILQNQAPGYLVIYQAWTLPIELLFYLISPFFIRTKKKIIIFIALYSILFFGIILPFKIIPERSLTMVFMQNLPYFILGSLSYQYVYKRIKNIKGLSKRIKLPALYLFFIGFLVLYQYLNINFIFTSQAFRALYYIAFAIFIAFIFNMKKSSKIDRAIGELSYPVYISHFVFIKLISPITLLATSLSGLFIVVLSTIAFSILLNKFIQNPVDNFRHSLMKKSKKN